MPTIPRRSWRRRGSTAQGTVRVFVSIVLPMSRNALITAGLFCFLFAWARLPVRPHPHHDRGRASRSRSASTRYIGAYVERLERGHGHRRARLDPRRGAARRRPALRRRRRHRRRCQVKRLSTRRRHGTTPVRGGDSSRTTGDSKETPKRPRSASTVTPSSGVTTTKCCGSNRGARTACACVPATVDPDQRRRRAPAASRLGAHGRHHGRGRRTADSSTAR